VDGGIDPLDNVRPRKLRTRYSASSAAWADADTDFAREVDALMGTGLLTRDKTDEHAASGGRRARLYIVGAVLGTVGLAAGVAIAATGPHGIRPLRAAAPAKRVTPVAPPRAAPPATGFPTESSTGPKVSRFRVVGGTGTLRITQPGVVYDGYDFRGRQLYVTADNVTFRNSLFGYVDRVDTAVIDNRGAHLRIEDSAIDGGPNFNRGLFAIGASQTILRSRFTHTGPAAVEGSEFWVQDSWIGLMGTNSGDHVDGLQVGSDGPVTILHNTILLSPVNFQNSPLGIWAELGNTGNVRIENNLLAGGGACVYIEQKAPYRFVGSVIFRNNAFSTRFYRKCGDAGPLYPNGVPAQLLWTGNYFYESKQPVSLQAALALWG
jgi:hypothetical protein